MDINSIQTDNLICYKKKKNMELKISDNADANYLASIIEVKNIRGHSNADKLK